jgi:hypothetical protein
MNEFNTDNLYPNVWFSVQILLTGDEKRLPEERFSPLARFQLTKLSLKASISPNR